MNLLDTVTLDLLPTRTYARREVQFFGRDADGFAGCIIRLWHGRRAGSRLAERDFYEVVEADPDPGVLCRQFVFLNRTDPDQQFPYKVRVGRESSCTCRAGLCRVPGDENTDGCKHRDAIEAVIEAGVLDGLDDGGPLGVYEDEPTAAELTGTRGRW